MSPFVTTWGARGSPTLLVPPAGMAISRPPKAAAAVRHRLQQMVLPSRREPAALPTLPAHHRRPPQGSCDVERVQNTMPHTRLPICHPSKGPPALRCTPASLLLFSRAGWAPKRFTMNQRKCVQAIYLLICVGSVLGVKKWIFL